MRESDTNPGQSRILLRSRAFRPPDLLSGRRGQIQSSPLRSLSVSALGGELELVARFPDGRVKISSFSDEAAINYGIIPKKAGFIPFQDRDCFQAVRGDTADLSSRTLLSAAILAGILVGLAFAQSRTVDILGTVQDRSGAVVRGH
jgi:hypothetical protein